jgi:antitoxin PrlF
MVVARSRVTAQGQISVPANIRRKLGIGPGSVLEWEEAGNRVLIKRSARFTSEDVHEALFPKRPPVKRTAQEMKEGIRQRTRDRYARS